VARLSLPAQILTAVHSNWGSFCSVFHFRVHDLALVSSTTARGDLAFTIDEVVFDLAGVGLLLLSFYVVDAIQLNSNFIRMFGREVTKWSREVVKQSHRKPPLTEKELSAYNEIFFVAQRTQVVAPLIWYPLLVLTLIILARASLFDNWTWPPALVFIYAITGAWALESAILLRRGPSSCVKLHSMTCAGFACWARKAKPNGRRSMS